MPYIPKNQRGRATYLPSNPGELNFHLSKEVEGYIAARGISYTTYNEVLGVLTAMQLELYRRFIAPYEDQKLEENGEVFTTLIEEAA